MTPILSISGLTKSYASGLQALKSIDLDIGKGEIFALLGPNGAGKTTLINIVCGIVNATSGKVLADGHDIKREYRQARSKIGLVPQELTTDAFESVWATVPFSRGLFGRPPNAAFVEKTLRDLSESVMREVIGDRTVDEVLTIGRHDIETSTLKRLADLCSQYDLGIQIQQVQLTSVRPPPAVQAAFNDVNQAQQEKQTAINQAWAVYNDAVPNARGQAKEREKQAEAYAFRRVNEAKGEAQKFSLLLTEYRKAPEVTRRRLYLEAMQAILPSLQKKIIVDDSLKNILQTLPLQVPGESRSSP